MTDLPKDYVFVSERIDLFHEKYPNGSIQTFFLKKGWLNYFIAKVIPDIAVPERYFTGSSFWELNGEKAFEKLETNAIGRALNIAGFETKNMSDRGDGHDTLPISSKSGNATQNQITLIQKKITKKGITQEQLSNYLTEAYWVEFLSELTKFQASTIIIDLNDSKQIEAIKTK